MSPLFKKKESKQKIHYIQKIIPYTGDDENLKLVFSRIWKMCDKCNMVFPFHYFMCLGCNGTKLREFQIHNNMAELEKNDR